MKDLLNNEIKVGSIIARAFKGVLKTNKVIELLGDRVRIKSDDGKTRVIKYPQKTIVVTSLMRGSCDQ